MNRDRTSQALILAAFGLGAFYLAWGLGMSVAAVAVETLSARLHPGAGFVAFAGLLAVQACLAGRRPASTI